MFQQKLPVLFLVLLTIYNALGEDPILKLSNGLIQGRESTTFANTTYYAFQKIPYAEPPTGELRFKAPRPAKNWDGTLDAAKLDVICYQLQSGDVTVTESEDCLFLNVFSPKLPTDGQNVSLPVMLYIHGGGFVTGSSLDAAPDLFVDNGVVLVSVNYRLGIFGFLSTEDDVIPGNNGLKDQRLAIQWTHDNIHLFGGNPEQITIFGESAGSASVAYQLLNQKSQGLFQGAILESGVSISPWAYQRKARSTAFNIAAIFNSNFTESDGSKALLEYLQHLDARDLNDVAIRQKEESDSVNFVPVIEVKNSDAFITRKMYKLLKAGNFIRVPILVGFNSEEGLFFFKGKDPETLKVWDDDLTLLVPNDMQITDPEKLVNMGTKIRDLYTKGGLFFNNYGAAVKYFSDNSFTRSIIKFGELASKYTDTYFYQFSYDGDLGGISLHYDGAESVGHTEELRYIFCSGPGCDFSNYPEADQITSKRLIKIWTDFAKYQNPTPDTSELLQNIVWPKVSLENGDFFYVNLNETLEIENHPKEETYRQWEELYDSLNFDDFDTY